MTTTFWRSAVGVAAAVLALAACGGDEPRELSGSVREPAPEVGHLSLPDLTANGAEFTLRAEEDQLLAVYFGYTNCPDFCPTSMSDLKLATQRLDDPSLVDVAFITIDPGRDLPVIADYITSFFPDGHGLGTDDSELLAEVAEPFGAQYQVTTNDDGEIEVAHSTPIYLVDDQGHLILTWLFGTSIDDLHADLDQLLDEASA